MSAFVRYALAIARSPAVTSGSEADSAARSARSACLRKNFVGFTTHRRSNSQRETLKNDPGAGLA